MRSDAVNTAIKQETRIIPGQVPVKFYAQHLKPYEFIRKFAAGKKVLEVGCGDGYGSMYLAMAATEVVGIDYEEEVVARAKEKYKLPNLTFMHSDGTSLDFDSNSFDIICSFQVIEHIPEEKLPRYLSEISRALKDGGTFYLSTLNLEHTMKSALTYEKNLAHCKEFRLRELKELLSETFPSLEIYGLRLTLRHYLYQKLKKAGILNFLPSRINPVKKFYCSVTTDDFTVTSGNLRKAIDFICACRK